MRVEHGDWLRGDADGVIVLPLSRADDIVSVAEEISTIEDRIRMAVGNGGTLAEIRHQTSYHQLQTRSDKLRA